MGAPYIYDISRLRVNKRKESAAGSKSGTNIDHNRHMKISRHTSCRVKQTTATYFSVRFECQSLDRLLTTANPTITKAIQTCEKQSLPVSVYALLHAVWPMEIIVKT